ncbi:MAG TPA: hypothetical protein VFS43_00570 [Polyangiaceae bacterium]|nr:hypothetical protein [Polyangiaceae bacterium]
MYARAIDERRGLVVWYPSRPNPADWEAHLRDVAQINGWSKRLGFRPAVLLLADEFDRPDAKMRQRLAQITGERSYDPYIAFVNANAVLRGVLTMLSWMHPRPSYDLTYSPDESAGIAWLEQRRGERLPELRLLSIEARGQVRKASLRKDE